MITESAKKESIDNVDGYNMKNIFGKWRYWLKDRSYEAEFYSLYIDENGQEHRKDSNSGEIGIRPVINIDINNTYWDIDNNSDGLLVYNMVYNGCDDKEKPTIMLKGKTEINILKDSVYKDKGVVAEDNFDGYLGNDVIIGGDVVDTTICKSYYITYDVIDSFGNAADTVIRKINVLKEMPELNGCNLELGDYVKFGKYNDEKILWRVIKKDEYKKIIKLISDKILTLKAYDASELGQNDNGINKWSECNLRDWLNSSSVKLLENEWNHQKPLNPTYNNYVNNSGFLYNFTINERNKILRLNEMDEIDSYADKVSIPSLKDLNLLPVVGYKGYSANFTSKVKYENDNNIDGCTRIREKSYWIKNIGETNNLSYQYTIHSDDCYNQKEVKDGSIGVRVVISLDTTNMSIIDLTGPNEEIVYDVIDIIDKEKLLNNISDRKYFKYYIGLDDREVIKCMLVCGVNDDGSLKKIFSNDDILDKNTHIFKKNFLYIDKLGEIKKY